MGALDDLKVRLATTKVSTYKRRSKSGKIAEVKEHERGGGPGGPPGRGGEVETDQHREIREQFESDLEEFGRERANELREAARQKAHADRPSNRKKKKRKTSEGGAGSIDELKTKLAAREFPETSRKKMAKSGSALPGGGFPIPDVDALKRAIQSVGRAKDPAAAKRHIKKRARALGAENLIPEGW